MSMISERLRKARQGVKEEDSPAAQALRLAAYGAASGRLREQEEQEAQGLQSLRLAAYGAAQDAALANARRPAPSYAGTLRAVPDSGTGTSAAKQAAQQEYEAGKERARYLDFSTGAELQRRLREAEDALSLSGGGRAEDAAARAAKAELDKWQSDARAAQSDRWYQKAEKAVAGLDQQTINELSSSRFGYLDQTLAMLGLLPNAQEINRAVGTVSYDAAWQNLREKGYSDEQIRELREYVEAVQNEERAAERRETAREETQSGVAGAIGTNAAAVLSAPARALGLAESLRSVLPEWLGGYHDSARPMDVNSPYRDFGNYKANVSEATHEMIDNPVGEFVYDAGVSAIESAYNMMLAGGIANAATGGSAIAGGLGGTASVGGEIGSAAENLTQVTARTMNWVMGSEVASDAVADEVRKGHGNLEALMLGVIRGAIEGLTEQYSVGEWLNEAAAGKAAWKVLASAAGAEGMEEVASNWLNYIVDYIAEPEEARELTPIYERYKAQGMSDAEALGMALLEHNGTAFLSGALSGFAMSGTAYAVGSLQQMPGQLRANRANRAYGQFAQTGETVGQIGDVTVPGVDEATAALIESGLESPDGTESRRMAEAALARARAGQEISARMRGELAAANAAQVASEESAATEGAQEERPTGDRGRQIVTEGNPRSGAAPTENEAARAAENVTLTAEDRAAEVRRVAVEEAGLSAEAGDTLADIFTQAAPEGVDPATFAAVNGYFYQAGERGLPFDNVRESIPAGAWSAARGTEEVAQYAYNRGRMKTLAQEAEAERRQREAERKAAERAQLAREAERNRRLAASEAGLHEDDFTRANLSADDARRIDETARLLGTPVYVVGNNEINAGRANGELVEGRAVLLEQGLFEGENAGTSAGLRIAGHEWGHRLKRLAPTEYGQVVEALRPLLTKEIEQKRHLYNEQNGLNYSDAELTEEAVNDRLGDMLIDGRILDEFIAEHRQERGLLQRMWEGIKTLARKLTGAEKRAAQSAEAKLRAALDAAATAARRESSESRVQSSEGTENAAQEGGEGAGSEFSLKEDSEGRELTEAQAAYFADSKAVDEDGRLLVLYHGTDADFTVFDPSKGRANMDIQGMFFSPWDIDAGGYGGNVGAYYLNLTNPASEAVGYKALNRFKGQNNAGVKAREWLIAQGYDGVNNGGEEYIAFYPEQIKRTDNLSPTGDPDVRYSLKERDEAYAAAVESGDMDTAQRMVDEAARAAGYTIKAYHGTRSDEFTVFDASRAGQNYGGYNAAGGGFDFTNTEDWARRWGAKAKGNGNVRVIPVYLKAGKTFYSYNGAVDPELAEELPKSMTPKERDAAMENGAAFHKALDDHKINFKTTIRKHGYDSYSMYPGADNISIYDPENIKSADPVTYDDDGKVIPLSERFNEAEEDIRYSLKTPDEATLTALQRENERLQKRVEYWRGQTKQTRGLHLRSGDLSRLTGQLVKDYGAELDEGQTAALEESLRRLGRIMREDPKGLQYSEMLTGAEEIARELVQNARELVNDDEYQDYRDLRKWLRGQKLTISRSDAAGIADFNDWKKAHSAIRVGYDNGGLPIDTAYAELAEQFPGFFPESIDNPTDQLERIGEILDSVGPVYENPYSPYMAAAIEEAGYDVLERIMDADTVRPTAPTRADRQAAAARERMEARLEDQAGRYEERLQKYRDTLKKVREQRDAELTRVRRAHKLQQQRQSAAKLRARIERHARELYGELTRPTDKKHIPEALRSSVAKVLQAINLESGKEYAYVGGDYKLVQRGTELGAEPTKKTQLFAAMKEQLAKAENSGEATLDPNLLGFDGETGLLDEVIAMGDKPLADMSREELQKVWDVLQQVEKAVKDWNKAFAAGRYATISEIAGALWGENARKRDTLTLAGAAGRAQQLFNLDMLTPEAYFHRLGPTGDALFRALRRAQDNDTRLLELAVQKAQEAIGKYDVRKAEQETVKVILGGEEAELTRAQLMEVYVLLRREQALKHLEGGILPAASRKGIVQNQRSEPYRMNSIEELATAAAELTDEERRIAEALQRFVTVTAAEWGNEASMAVYGYKKFGGEEHYWPLHVNRQDVKSTIESESGKSSVKNYGFSKPLTPNANNSVRIGSIFDTFAEHVAEMATYSTHLEIMEDLTRVLNYKQRNEAGLISWNVKGVMDRVFGRGGTSYLQTLLEQLSYGVRGETIGGDFMSATSGRYKGSAIGANLRVIFQQPTAILRTLDMIRPDYLAEGLGSWRRGWQRAQKYAPIAKWKSWGYFDVATGKSIKSLMFNSDSKLGKFNSALMAPAGVADAFAWGQLWSACEKELEAQIKRGSVQGVEPGTEAFFERVAGRFSEIVDRTQVVDGILQRSQIMRSPDRLVKMATSFMAEPTKQYNQFMSAVYDLRHSGGKDERRDAMKHLARTLLALLASFAANAAAQSLIDAMRDDDREKKYIERFLGAYPDNLLGNINPLSFVPWARDISSIIQGYSVDRMDMATVSNIVSAVKGTTKALEGEGKKSVANALLTLTAEAARLFGLPVANIKRDVLAIINTVATETDNYLMQYEIDKVLYPVQANTGRYAGILWKAYQNDQEQYKTLYERMVADGIDEEKLKSAMENRMKKAEGVNKASDLSQRYMSPEQKSRYDGLHKGLERSSLWRQASGEERERVEDKLYSLVAETSTENSAGTKLQEKIDAARKAGISEGEYVLYLLALSMADEPNSNGNYGSYTNDEQEAALDMLDGLSREDKSWLWMSTHDSDKNNPYK